MATKAAVYGRIPRQIEIQAELSFRSLAWFFRCSWRVIEPTAQLKWNWHLQAVCDHVQAVLEDWIKAQKDPLYVQRIKDLVINVPPGTSKSRIVSVCAPAWMWLHYPSWRGLFVSSNPRVAQRDSMWCRDLIQSDWYQEWFRPAWELRDDQNAKNQYWNTAGGIRMAGGLLSSIVGDRADGVFIDDPHDPDDVHRTT